MESPLTIDFDMSKASEKIAALREQVRDLDMALDVVLAKVAKCNEQSIGIPYPPPPPPPPPAAPPPAPEQG
jgi:hypothetical protein